MCISHLHSRRPLVALMLASTENHSVAEPLTCSPKHRTSRRQSLRLPPHPLNIPIPPTLLQSPYLNSPQSIFQRTISAPQHPNAEDERWLQDTVPFSLDGGGDHGQRASSSPPLRSDASREETGQSQDDRPLAHSAPPSPPLVRWRGSSNTLTLLSQGRYFIDTA